jgi:hypothetical protein
MMRKIGFLIGATLAMASEAQEAASWATVPASKDYRQLGVLGVPSPPTEAIVTVVNQKGLESHAPLGPRRVFAFDIGDQAEGTAAGHASASDEGSVIPVGAFWPGAGGRITATVPEAGAGSGRQTIRNPWEVRIHPKVARPDSVFICGGIIDGGASEPVAFVNGRIERRGDILDGFVVDAVATSAVVLNRNGLKYVLPVGRRTAIATEEP